MKCITTVSNVSKSLRYDKPSLLWTPPPPVIISCKTSYTNFQRWHSMRTHEILLNCVSKVTVIVNVSTKC